ncbi:ABC-3 protein [Rhodomicrobium vannielii ATCC 17100]|uniref:High-affinity zinc uptake system membrane protein ZnuB n=1 Tax=Rhodomicrobium vannielii (strain ATCC 17100 / DSM 162 / LMG 4299 / NCIMB 10020 / ATH 3.1.1) TaxID=648757 RepID=E3I0E3_RHOVT|nr:metal ABC transporter permease [Rhodomicrobium vannielii]ADP72261.1 ABC-3 protein [Rhodomicrobium vannielii ATCC 17100]
MLDDFVTRAVLAGLGAAALAAPLGCFVVWRRMAYFGETVAYSGLLGVALGFLLGVDLTLGVIVTAIAMALLLSGLQAQRAIPYDTLLGILAHVALASGLIAANFVSGARLDLMGYLFGDILAVSRADVFWIWGGAAAVLAALTLLWRPLLALTVHEELAAAEGVRVRRTETAFILLIAVTVALAMKVIGILLITSLMIFPAAVARPFAKTPEQMAVLAALAAALAVAGGLFLSLKLDTAAGPSIVLALAALFFVAAVPALALRGR